jgi:DNA-binding NarL/FixJ family response regulator
VRRPLITVHSDDPGLHGDLGENLPVARGRRPGLLRPSPDVVFVDAGPPAPASMPGELRRSYPSAFVVLVARKVDAQALELGAELDADAFVRRDDELADTATALLALAAIARHGDPEAGKTGKTRRTWTSRRKG